MAVNKKTKGEDFVDVIEDVEQEVVVETVKDEPKSAGLPSVEADFVEETEAQDWYDYLRINLNELEDGDEYWGRPYLTDIESVQFDEEEQPKHRCRLLIIDDEEQEYLQININLKTSDTVQTNVHNASSLYALIAGLQNLDDPKWSSRYNRIRKVNVTDWQEYVNKLEGMNVKVVAKTGSSFTYNSFKIIEAN